MAKTTVAHSETDLCNLALIMVGGDTILNLDDDTDTDGNAVLCRQTFPLTKDICLTRWEWNGATKFADLGGARNDADQEQASWVYVFNLPDDCLHVIAQIDEGNADKKFKHKVMGRQLFTNDLSNEDGTSAYIEYISTSEIANFSPQLLEYIVLKQAIVMAPKLMGVTDASAVIIGDMKRDLRLRVEPNAIGRNQDEGDVDGTDDEGNVSWLDAR